MTVHRLALGGPYPILLGSILMLSILDITLLGLDAYSPYISGTDLKQETAITNAFRFGPITLAMNRTDVSDLHII